MMTLMHTSDTLAMQAQYAASSADVSATTSAAYRQILQTACWDNMTGNNELPYVPLLSLARDAVTEQL
jgi:hypothetical protein